MARRRKMRSKKTSEAQMRATNKWREKNKDRYKRYEVKINVEDNPDIVEHMEAQANKNQYLMDLIKKDLKNT